MAAHVVVIGGGSTGSAVAHDLALRGLAVTVLERGEVASGTTGRNHCLLHSGARYCVTDQESARECITEVEILDRIMPDLLERNGGLFVAINESDLAFKDQFLDGCSSCGIPAREVPVAAAMKAEPFLNPEVLAAVEVPDGVFEPFHFCLAFLATAKVHGAVVRTYTEVLELVVHGAQVTGVVIKDHLRGTVSTVDADVVVNAAGPWVGKIAAMAGVRVPVTPTPGVMVTLDARLNNRVINRLNRPADGDIVVPQRATSIIGTTSWVVEDPDLIPVPAEHVSQMLAAGEELIPAVAKVRVRASAAVARPLVTRRQADSRAVSRTFECFDHSADGIGGFVTIAGGKTTSSRAMAERAADVVCAQLAISTPCSTRDVPLVSYRTFYQ
ncbi:MAG: FAD-dependent oxidoreductase [Candidatus Dormibacteraeota bacterium]|nr:FAD-dependent oxidoreductase [Candidatus Dormibacteraeota bacterium]